MNDSLRCGKSELWFLILDHSSFLASVKFFGAAKKKIFLEKKENWEKAGKLVLLENLGERKRAQKNSRQATVGEFFRALLA